MTLYAQNFTVSARVHGWVPTTAYVANLSCLATSGLRQQWDTSAVVPN